MRRLLLVDIDIRQSNSLIEALLHSFFKNKPVSRKKRESVNRGEMVYGQLLIGQNQMKILMNLTGLADKAHKITVRGLQITTLVLTLNFLSGIEHKIRRNKRVNKMLEEDTFDPKVQEFFDQLK